MNQIKGACYTRCAVSQSDDIFDWQLHLCLEYAKRMAVEIPEEYRFSDKAVSGATLRRPGLQQLFTAVKEASDIKYVFIADLSKLSLRSREVTDIIIHLLSNDKDLIAVRDGIDTRDSRVKSVFLYYADGFGGEKISRQRAVREYPRNCASSRGIPESSSPMSPLRRCVKKGRSPR